MMSLAQKQYVSSRRALESSLSSYERSTRTWRWTCEQTCHSVPSPPAGEGQGGGCDKRSYCCQYDAELRSLETLSTSELESNKQLHAQRSNSTPLPVPPPQGGRERCGSHLRNSMLRCLGSVGASIPVGGHATTTNRTRRAPPCSKKS